MTEVEAAEWQERLRAGAAVAVRRREARASARRERALRRTRGVSERLAWRQARLDVREAERDLGRPSDA